MGRGSSGQRRLAEQQQAQYNQMIQQLMGERKEARGELMPLAQRRYQEAGLSPKEESALTQETVGGIGTVYDTARQRSASRVARTRNPAGYYEAMGEVGREESREKEGAQRRNVLTRRQAKRSDEDTALQLMANLYGIDTSALQSIAGLPIGALNARAAGISQGGFNLGPFGFSY